MTTMSRRQKIRIHRRCPLQLVKPNHSDLPRRILYRLQMAQSIFHLLKQRPSAVGYGHSGGLAGLLADTLRLWVSIEEYCRLF